jgi:hypothetical protein
MIIIIIHLAIRISGERIAIRKEAEHILKYKDFKIEIRHVERKTTVIPVIIGEIGTVSESFR